MPFVGEDGPPARKRRWDDDDKHGVFALYPSDQSDNFYVVDQRQELPPRKTLPAKRARIANDDDLLHDAFSPAHPTPHRRQRSSQLKVLPLTPNSRPAARPLLTPCHICHRKPTKKSDLDSFAECQGCGERTCFVCIRECHGWNLDDESVLSEQEVLSRSFHMDDVDDVRAHEQEDHHGSRPTGDGPRKGWDAGGHRAMVCSRCCIERGAEGDVACLGCLSRMEGK
ncbi:hypothetical protein G7046_g4606 [Stylonectria norvegica]|nr:hypothetical protein G7046_g4606 [Stylonectria norvegica]